MFGWEFPPFNKGGLGTACYGLTKGLDNKGVNVTFVLPKAGRSTKGHSTHVNLLVASDYYMQNDNIQFRTINSLLMPYISSEEYAYMYSKNKMKGKMKEGAMAAEEDEVYGKDLFSEVHRYADKAKLIAALEDYDVIHAHDWMTYKAGLEAKKISGKPLVVHVHATEFDRTGGNPNQYVYDLEREGMHGADRVITVSAFTKDKVVENYGVSPDKITVVHNAVTFNDNKFDVDKIKMSDTDKMVLFLGRITIQKGPDYFLYAAKKILDLLKEEKKESADISQESEKKEIKTGYAYSNHESDVKTNMDVKFVFAGTGDMEPLMVKKAAELGISSNVLFAGWVTGPDIDRLYSMADLYVMPSVSEPFGITPLEAMRNNTPCLISKQSGVSEVVSHCLKVDFWDVDEMANKIMCVLKHSPLQECLRKNGFEEVHKFSWDLPAEKCVAVYNSLL